jgi:hypothetical protein
VIQLYQKSSNIDQKLLFGSFPNEFSILKKSGRWRI